jgi:hypothetical protein
MAVIFYKKDKRYSELESTSNLKDHSAYLQGCHIMVLPHRMTNNRVAGMLNYNSKHKFANLTFNYSLLVDNYQVQNQFDKQRGSGHLQKEKTLLL